jgi:hypothetical protein
MKKRKVRSRRRRRLSGLALPPQEHSILADEGRMGLEDLVHSVEDAIKRQDCMGAYWMLMKANKMMGREVCHVRSAGAHPNATVRDLGNKITEMAEIVGRSCVKY